LGDFSQLAYFVDEYPYASIYSASMQDTIHSQILNALLIAIRPLARVLLRAGIGHREFNEVSKAAFVDVATKDYGLRGRPTNISRVAVMTGLTRKEVRRIRDKNESGENIGGTRGTPMGVLLHQWYTEPDFLNPDGTPLDLPFDGSRNSFSELVRRFGGDIPPGAMRTELVRIGVVEELINGRLRPLKRNVSKKEMHDRLIDGLTVVIYPALVALANNTDNESSSPAWVMRTASTSRVRENDVPRVRRIGSDRLTDFVESIDDLFVAYETLHDDDLTESSDKSVGVGVFYFEEKKSESHFFDKT
jgi:hypothetical protein